MKKFILVSIAALSFIGSIYSADTDRQRKHMYLRDLETIKLPQLHQAQEKEIQIKRSKEAEGGRYLGPLIYIEADISDTSRRIDALKRDLGI